MPLRVIFSSHPAHGHLNPLLPVAHACREAGHEVLFATAPPFCATVRSHGFQCRPAGLDYLWSEPLVSFPEIAHAPRGPEQIRWLAEQIGFRRLHRPMAEGVLEIARDFQPDLVVVDFADWRGRLAADVLGIPYVYCSWGYEADSQSRAVAPSSKRSPRRLGQKRLYKRGVRSTSGSLHSRQPGSAPSWLRSNACPICMVARVLTVCPPTASRWPARTC